MSRMAKKRFESSLSRSAEKMMMHAPQTERNELPSTMYLAGWSAHA